MANDDFDLDDFDLDDFDMDFNDDTEGKVKDPTKSKKRQTIEDVFSSSFKTVKGSVTDKKRIRDFLLNALPEEYKNMHDELDKGASDIKSLYDSAIKEIKPALHVVANKVDRLIPENKKVLKETLKSIKEKTETRQDTYSSQEDMAEVTIKNSLEDIFKTKEARDKKTKLLDESLKEQKFKITSRQLDSLNSNIAQLTSYTTNVTQAYQKKSLELQYRSYFVQSELLKTTNSLSEILTKQNEAIIKNTALPEYVKVQNSDIFKETLKRRSANALTDKIFAEGSLLDNFNKNFKRMFEDAKNGLMEGLSAIEQVSEGLGMAKEMDEAMGVKRSNAYKVGEIGSEFLLDKVLNPLNSKLKNKLSNNKKVTNFGKKAYRYFQDPELLSEALQGSKFYKEAEYGSLKEKVGQLGLDLLNINNSANMSGVVNADENLSSSSIFTTKTNKSITEIIPGYLSRILRELSIIRTGNEGVPSLHYDFNKGSFVTDRTLSSKISKELGSKASNYSLDNYTKELLNKISPNKDLSESSEVKRVLLDAIMSSGSSSPKKLISALESTGSPIAKELIEGLNKQIVNKEDNAEDLFELTKSYKNIRSSFTNVNDVLNKYIDQGYSDILEKLGVISIDDDGGYKVDKQKYLELVVTGKLDTKLNQTYKSKGVGGFKTVKSSNIDLVPSNESYYSSTTDESPKSDNVFNINSKSISELTDVNKETNNILNKIYDKIDKGLNITIERLSSVKGNDFLNSAKDISGNIISKITDSVKGMGSVTSSIFNPISNFGKNIVSKLLDNKEFITEGIGSLLKNTFDISKGLLGSLYENSKSLAGKLLGLGGSTGSLIKKGIDYVLDYVGDIYIPGTYGPVLKANLMKVGEYIDQRTGKVIKSVKDITGTVIDSKGDVVLTLEDFGKGLYDKFGNKIKLPYEKILSYISDKFKQGKERLKGLYGFGKNIIKGGFDLISGKHSSSNKEFISDKALNVLKEIRDILKDKFYGSGSYFRPTNSSLEDEGYGSDSVSNQPEQRYTSGGSLLDRVSNVYNKFKDRNTNKVKDLKKRGKGFKGKLSGIMSLAGSFIPGLNQEQTDIPKGPKQSFKEKLQNKTSKVKRYIKSKKGILDDNGDGVKDNSVLDRLNKEKEREEARKGKASKADLSLRYRQGNVLDGILSKLGSFISKAGSILSGLASLASAKGIKNVLGSVLDKFKGPKTGKPSKGFFNRLGKGIKNIGKIGLSIGKTAGKFALGSSGLLLRGAAVAGSALLTAGGYAATAALSVISSPVVLGAAAVSAVGYGLYKGYDLLTRDKTDKLNSIRLAQYGLTLTDLDKHHVHELLELEEYLNKDKIGYKKGTAYILSRKIDLEDIYSIFSIDPEDKEGVEKFLDWFNNRFKPFFLTNLTALFSINPKLQLKDLDELSEIELSKFLSLIKFDSGPYSYKVSPFKDIDELPDTRDITSNFITIALASINEKKLKYFSNKQTRATVKEAEKAKRNSRISVKSKSISEEIQKEVKRQNTTRGSIRNKQKDIPVFTGEEATIKENNQPVTDTTPTLPPTATGPYADGSEGYNYIIKGRNVTLEGMNENMKKNFLAMAEEYGKLTGKSIHVNSGYRSTEEQARLYRQNPRKAARPGRSLHEFGLAVDINTVDANKLDKLGLMRKYGFTRPVGGETWHVEPSGIQGHISEAKINKSLADDLVMASLGRGGGGYATKKGAKKNRRDNRYALSIFEAAPSVSKTSSKEQDKKLTNIVDIKTKKHLNVTEVQKLDKKPNKIIPTETVTKPVISKTNEITDVDRLHAQNNAEVKPKNTVSVFNQAKKPLDSGQSLAGSEIDTNVSLIAETLTESLNVHKEALGIQKDILEVIKLVAENTDSEKLGKVKEELTRPTNTIRNNEVPELPVKLKRRV